MLMQHVQMQQAMTQCTLRGIAPHAASRAKADDSHDDGSDERQMRFPRHQGRVSTAFTQLNTGLSGGTQQWRYPVQYDAVCCGIRRRVREEGRHTSRRGSRRKGEEEQEKEDMARGFSASSAIGRPA